MKYLLAEYTVSISELKANPAETIERAADKTIAILNKNKLTAYLVSPVNYEKLLDAFDELESTKVVKQRLKDDDKAVEITLNDL